MTLVRSREPGNVSRPRLLVRLASRGSAHAVELAALALIVGVFVAVTALVLAERRMLAHDESVYAVLARHWLEGTPATGVADHRAPLLPLLGVPVLWLGGDETALRALGVAGGVGLIVATWWVARRVGGGLAGLGAAAVIATSPTVLNEARRFLTDVPSAALLVAMTGVIWWQLEERTAPDWRLLLVAPLAWTAYELRYGSALIVLIVFATTAVLCRHAVRRHLRLVAGTVGLLVLLLVPHLVISTLDMGSPWARVLYTSEMAGRDYLGQGLVEYVRWFPVRLAGPLAAALAAVGIVGTALAWVRGFASRRALVFLVIPAVVDVVAIGMVSHGEPRFVLFSIALWCAAGATLVARLVQVLAVRAPTLAGSTLLLAGLLVAAQLALVVQRDLRTRRVLVARDAPFEAALSALADEGGASCSVLTSYSPQATWYTSCASYHFGDPPRAGAESSLSADAWMLLLEDGKRQPAGELLRRYESLAHDPPREWRGPDPEWVRLYELDAPSAGS